MRSHDALVSVVLVYPHVTMASVLHSHSFVHDEISIVLSVHNLLEYDVIEVV